MSFHLTPEAAASPRRTIHAAEILHDNARSIAAFCHEAEADEVVCAQTPEPFYAVGAWYEDFGQTTDEEVRDLLEQAEGLAAPR